MNFIYENLARNLNEKAFDFCLVKIYPLLSFKVVQLEDTRRIDLAEKLYSFEKDISLDLEMHDGTVGYYQYLQRSYLRDFAKCKKGTRAERYYERAVEIIGKHSTSVSELKDSLMILLSLLFCKTKVTG